jgi:hypothetical protein
MLPGKHFQAEEFTWLSFALQYCTSDPDFLYLYNSMVRNMLIACFTTLADRTDVIARAQPRITMSERVHKRQAHAKFETLCGLQGQ